jgi:hypothetical protein
MTFHTHIGKSILYALQWRKTKVSELSESKNIMYTIEHSILFTSMAYVPRPFGREDMGGERFSVYLNQWFM